MVKDSKIYIAGHTGLVGSALVRKFTAECYNNLVYTPWPEYDLRNQQQTNDFFKREKPEYVIIAAAKVGGILANNTYRAEFIYDNIMIAANIIHAAYLNKVRKLIFLGSSCIYPKNCPQPMKEEYLLTDSLEPTNEPYAIAKIAGIKLCENYYRQYGCNFYSVMPTNLYGPNDNFNLETSHVLPAILRKIHLAKCLEQYDYVAIRKDLKTRPFSITKSYSDSMTDDQIKNLLKEYGIEIISEIKTNDHQLPTVNCQLTLWGTGKPRREFLFVDDLSSALYFLLNEIDSKEIYQQGITHINIGTGKDITINELANITKKIVDYNGEIIFDKLKPDGTVQKLLDISRIENFGWKSKISINYGIKKTYEWLMKNY